MHDPLTWQDIWAAGLGSALLAGIAAAIIARATVYWTQRGDEAAAALVESRRAAEALTRQAAKTFGAIAEADRPGTRLPLSDWLNEVLVELPVIADDEISRRVDTMSDDWMRYAMWLERQQLSDWYVQDQYGGGVDPVDDWLEKLHAHKEILGERYKWVGISLAAHRRGSPLPDPAKLPALGDPPLRPPPPPPLEPSATVP